VGDSILGEGVNLGAGVKLANRRFDDSPITLVYADQKIKTGLKKMGAIIGDKTQMGCNAVTSPGTLIGPNSFCYPNVTVQGILPRRTIYKGKKL
jgi:acetyltransferase-like isoleucine patch superfamily enzyme